MFMYKTTNPNPTRNFVSTEDYVWPIFDADVLKEGLTDLRFESLRYQFYICFVCRMCRNCPNTLVWACPNKSVWVWAKFKRYEIKQKQMQTDCGDIEMGKYSY